LCKTISLILRRKGYAVTTAKDGSEAIVRIKERPFDMVFVDIKMPLMDGVETYRRIKKIRPEAVVMMMTPYVVEDWCRRRWKKAPTASSTSLSICKRC
jgi:CheY-like chemotaxis protein